MKTLIVLKGLVKKQKRDWVRKQGLEQFFLDYDDVRRLYSAPELINPNECVLSFAFSDTVYRRFVEILCARLSKGCLVVIDIDNLSRTIIDVLAHIFGYKVFLVIQEIPADFLQNPKKYTNPDYPVKTKQELVKDVQNYYNTVDSGEYEPEKIITRLSDVSRIWHKEMSKFNIRKVKTKAKILHVSDTHSNVNLLDRLPKENFDMCVFYGDYIDGPIKGGSRRMLDIALESNNENIIWLEGNHELRLRKYLGAKYLRKIKKNYLADLLVSSLPADFLEGTAREFDDLDGTGAWDYIDQMNKKLKMFFIISTKGAKYYCSHSGFRYLEQFDMRFIGTVVYGSRNIDSIDRTFYKKVAKHKNIWSIHAHCKYQDMSISKYPKVFNIDPPDEFTIILLKQYLNTWNTTLLCQEEKLN